MGGTTVLEAQSLTLECALLSANELFCRGQPGILKESSRLELTY